MRTGKGKGTGSYGDAPFSASGSLSSSLTCFLVPALGVPPETEQLMIPSRRRSGLNVGRVSVNGKQQGPSLPCLTQREGNRSCT